MDQLTSIKLELGINAQQIIQQVQINNKNIEEQVSKGIELALKDIVDGDNFIQMIREQTVTELSSIVSKSVMSWEVKNRITKLIEAKVMEKIEEYADNIAEKITSTLK